MPDVEELLADFGNPLRSVETVSSAEEASDDTLEGLRRSPAVFQSLRTLEPRSAAVDNVPWAYARPVREHGEWAIRAVVQRLEEAKTSVVRV